MVDHYEDSESKHTHTRTHTHPHTFFVWQFVNEKKIRAHIYPCGSANRYEIDK